MIFIVELLNPNLIPLIFKFLISISHAERDQCTCSIQWISATERNWGDLVSLTMSVPYYVESVKLAINFLSPIR